MLPTNPKSQLSVSQADKNAAKSAFTPLSNYSVKQWTTKAGSLIAKNPFWSLVIGSLGIHAAFVLATPSPLQKVEVENTPVKFSKIPLVNLPPKTLLPQPKADKSLLNDLFVKSSTPKSNTAQDPSLQLLDLSNLDRLEDLPPIADLPLGIPPLLNNSIDIDAPQFVKPQFRLPSSNSPSPLFPDRIDNSNNANNRFTSSNIRPEFQGGGIKNETSAIAAAPRRSQAINPDNNNLRNVPTTAQKFPVSRPPVTRNTQPPTATNRPAPPKTEETPVVTDPPISPVSGGDIAGGNILSFVATNKRIKNLIDNNLLVTTQIAPEEALIPNPEQTREKGVSWIPPKLANVGNKRGTIVCYWIVAPNGEIQLAGYTSGDKELVDADRELVDIVLETAKGYKFKPIENPQTGIYRLVTAKYSFPYQY